MCDDHEIDRHDPAVKESQSTERQTNQLRDGYDMTVKSIGRLIGLLICLAMLFATAAVMILSIKWFFSVLSGH